MMMMMIIIIMSMAGKKSSDVNGETYLKHHAQKRLFHIKYYVTHLQSLIHLVGVIFRCNHDNRQGSPNKEK